MRVPNPVRLAILWVGLGLARLGLIDRERSVRTTDLAWPRIVTGIARMSKSAADVAMVGIAVGSAAIAGVGFATPFWGAAFSIGGGIAGGTISLVSQRYGADAYDELDRSVKASAVVAVLATVPFAAAFHFHAEPLIGLIGGDNQAAIGYGAAYLEVIAVGVPFAALNLIGSRTLVGADDAWTPMVLRAGGAAVNVSLNAVFIFVLGFGVVGAALGTVIGNVVVSVAFAVGLLRGGLPLVGEFPVSITASGPYLDRELTGDLVRIATPLVFTNSARTASQFPLLAIVGMFGEDVVAAYVVARRVRGLMGTPGWGFSLASSSLVGQELGTGDESAAVEYAREILRFNVAVYLVTAALVAVFARPIARGFVSDPAVLPLTVVFVYVACGSVVFRGVSSGATGPLRASGDTRWPFYGQLLGLYAFAIPLAYLGATTPLGLVGVYASVVAETVVPAGVTYYRYASGAWMAISREYRPGAAHGDD